MTWRRSLTGLLLAAGILTAPAASRADNGELQYHGGAVLTRTPHVYFLWYGDWTGSPALPILTDFVSSLSDSPYYQMNTAHHDAAGRHVPKSISYSGSATDVYSQGTSLDAKGVLAALAAAFHRRRLPLDPNGLYFVLTSADVEETSGFCADYCSWHHHAKIAGVDVKYAFLGNPARCPEACELVPGNTPNGDAAADAMVAGLAARINEMVTNPDGDGWFDAAGLESTDKCLASADPFGPTYDAADGARANLRLGARNFLVPESWVNDDTAASGGRCALAAPVK
jgi:Phosphate-induced protein 1 conserved region